MEAFVCKFCGKKFSKEQVVAVLLQRLEDKSMIVKLQALDALRSAEDSTVINRLLKLIETIRVAKQTDPEVQLLNRTIIVLSEIGSPAISPELVSILKKTSSMLKATKLVELLAQFRDPSSIPALVDSLQKRELRDIVARSLEKFGDAAVPHLNQLAKDGKRADRKLAEQVLAKIKPNSN